MENCNALKHQTTRRRRLVACATALAAAFTVDLPQPAHAQRIIVPPVPNQLEVDAPNKVFLVGHGVGGIGTIHMLVCRLKLHRGIDRDVELLKLHVPYHESGHVLNVAHEQWVVSR